MELKEFIIVALPFPMSTAVSEFCIWGKDEDDARAEFERRYNLWQVKEVRRR